MDLVQYAARGAPELSLDAITSYQPKKKKASGTPEGELMITSLLSALNRYLLMIFKKSFPTSISLRTMATASSLPELHGFASSIIKQEMTITGTRSTT